MSSVPRSGIENDPALLALARSAADLVEHEMVVGLGSGSTAEAVIRELGQRVAGGLRIIGVPTSKRTADLAASWHIPLRSLDEIAESGESIDIGIDGADEIDPDLNATKGRGGALLYEKLVALRCTRFVLVAADAKLVQQLGTRLPLPVEIVPLGWRTTQDRLAAMGFRSILRADGPKGEPAIVGAPTFITDGGHYILDCMTGVIDDPVAVANAIKATSGVVEHGVFVGIADQALVAAADGTVRTIARGTAR